MLRNFGNIPTSEITIFLSPLLHVLVEIFVRNYDIPQYGMSEIMAKKKTEVTESVLDRLVKIERENEDEDDEEEEKKADDIRGKSRG